MAAPQTSTPGRRELNPGMGRRTRSPRRRRARLEEWKLRYLLTGKWPPKAERDDETQDGFIDWTYFETHEIEETWRAYREEIIAAHPERQPWALARFG